MNMFSVKTLFIGIVLLGGTFRGFAQETNTKARTSDFAHYGTHVVTDGVAKIVASIMIVVGGGLTLGAAANDCGPLCIIPGVVGISSGVYILYKTPQWTDTHLLNYSTERSNLQNIVTFLSRLLILYPVGTIAGELLTQ